MPLLALATHTTWQDTEVGRKKYPVPRPLENALNLFPLPPLPEITRSRAYLDRKPTSPCRLEPQPSGRHGMKSLPVPRPSLFSFPAFLPRQVAHPGSQPEDCQKLAFSSRRKFFQDKFWVLWAGWWKASAWTSWEQSLERRCRVLSPSHGP